MQTIRSEMGGLKQDVVGLAGDVRSLGGILGRIERGVEMAQERSNERENASRPNLVAIVAVLITIISIIVGGAWTISGSLAGQAERSEWMKERFDLQGDRLKLLEDRQYQQMLRSRGVSPNVQEQPAPPPQIGWQQ